MIYGGSHLAEAFRTVRKNTIQVAEDIPHDKYGFKAAPDVMSVAEMLSHLAANTWWPVQLHNVEHLSSVQRSTFMGYMQKCGEMAAQLTSKQQIVDALLAGQHDPKPGAARRRRGRLANRHDVAILERV
jgi:hypothetical protein